MAFPRSLSGVEFDNSSPYQNVSVPPVARPSTGDRYVVMKSSTNNNEVVCMKATTYGDAAWSAQDSGNQPESNSNEVELLFTCTAGDDLHVLVVNDAGQFYYSRFDMSDDSWDETDTLLITDTEAVSGTTGAAMAIRSDGDIIIVYESEETVDASTYRRVNYIYYDASTTTWETTPVGVDDGGSTDYMWCDITIGESDTAHIPYAEQGAVHNLYRKTMTSGYSLSSTAEVSDSRIRNQPAMNRVAAYYDDDGTERVTYVWRDNGNNLYSAFTDDGGTPDTPDDTGVSGDFVRFLACTVAYDDTVYVLYSDASDDLSVISNQDDGGWSSATAIVSSITLDKVHASVGENADGDTVLMILYGESDDIYYTEHVIVEAPETVSVAGAQSSSGTVGKQINKSFVGTQASAGVVTRQSNKVLAAAQTSAGAISRLIAKVFTGVQSNSGTIASSKTTTISLSGTQSSDGTLTRQINKVLAVAQTSAGAISRAISKVLSGSQTNSGTITSSKVTSVTLAGTQNSDGNVNRQTHKTLDGSQVSAGVIARLVSKVFAGVQSVSGAVTTAKIVLLSLAGTQSNSGNIAKQTAKSFDGEQSSSGVLSRLVSKLFGGSQSNSGVLSSVKTTLLLLAGTQSSSGDVARRTSKSVAGTQSSGGVVTKLVRLSLAGVQSTAGAITKLTGKVLVGVQSSTGAITKLIGKVLAGVQSLAGALSSSYDAGVVSTASYLTLTRSDPYIIMTQDGNDLSLQRGDGYITIERDNT